jgi:hypothetical protein
MNYLTNYYKNLSEQLQERVHKLERMLNEAYPGGMTPGRQEVLGKASLQRYGPDATPENIAKSRRAENLMRRGRETDMRKAAEERSAMERAAESHPDFTQKVIGHFSSGFADMFGGDNKEAAHTEIATRLMKKAGQGGFKSFDHASKEFNSVMQDSDTVRAHLENEAFEDPTKYGVHYDDIMDVDMSDEIDDLHSDIEHGVLRSMQPKKS